MTVERFLATLASGPPPCQPRRCWREEVGPDVVQALEHQGILEAGERATWYPCGGSCGGESQRQVDDEPLPADGSQETRWAAACGDEEVNCPTLKLSEQELTMLEFSSSSLAAWLRRALGATGPAASTPSRSNKPESLGRLIWEGEERDAVLALGIQRKLSGVLQDYVRLRKPTVVFVPSLKGLDTELLVRHAPGELVVLVDLRELVVVEAGRLVTVPPRSETQRVLSVREPVAAPYAAEPIVAEVFEPDGKRLLSARAYQELVQGRQALDLFIDLKAPGDHRGVRAGRRDAQGTFADVEISQGGGLVLAELVQTRRAVRCRDFHCMKGVDVTRTFERARKEIDVSVSRYRWRAFPTQGGSDPAARRFVFDPPAGFRFAVVMPVSG